MYAAVMVIMILMWYKKFHYHTVIVLELSQMTECRKTMLMYTLLHFEECLFKVSLYCCSCNFPELDGDHMRLL